MADKSTVPAIIEKPAPLSPDIIKNIAMDIGKEVVAYVEVMYPEAISSTSSTFKLSLRNTVYNEIMGALKTTDEDEIKARLAERKTFRRWWTAAFRKPESPADKAMEADRNV